MTQAPVALRLGPLRVEGYRVFRSGVRWLRDDGDICRPGEAIAFCNIGLKQIGGSRDERLPLHDEARDLQMALVTPVGGRLRRASGISLGGYHDFHLVNPWGPNGVIGHIEPEPGRSIGDADGTLRLLMMAGRRVTELAEGRAGLLSGWHGRSRACHVDGDGPAGTLLSLGVCEMLGVIKGESFAFLEILDAIAGPAQVIFVPDDLMVPSAPIVAEQMRRTPDEYEAIAQDLAASLAGGPIAPDPEDWMFAGAMLRALGASPVTESCISLTRAGLCPVGPPDAVVLSLHAEAATILRHRRLGYALKLHDYRMADAGRAFLPWLRKNFVAVRRTVQDIHADYRALIDLIHARAPATVILICNIMSTTGFEDIQSYEAFDAPMAASLLSIRAKDMNLMLHDLARERDVAIIDADAIAAELGGRRCLSDGVHQSGQMQDEVRAEILRVLQARGVPGFAPACVN